MRRATERALRDPGRRSARHLACAVPRRVGKAAPLGRARHVRRGLRHRQTEARRADRASAMISRMPSTDAQLMPESGWRRRGYVIIFGHDTPAGRAFDLALL